MTQLIRGNLIDLPEREERERRVAEWTQCELAYRFDLAQGLPFRVALIRLETQERVLLVAVHHIVEGGWSLRVLTR